MFRFQNVTNKCESRTPDEQTIGPKPAMNLFVCNKQMWGVETRMQKHYKQTRVPNDLEGVQIDLYFFWMHWKWCLIFSEIGILVVWMWKLVSILSPAKLYFGIGKNGQAMGMGCQSGANFGFAKLQPTDLFRAGNTNSTDCSSNVAQLKYWRVCLRTQILVKLTKWTFCAIWCSFWFGYILVAFELIQFIKMQLLNPRVRQNVDPRI